MIGFTSISPVFIGWAIGLEGDRTDGESFMTNNSGARRTATASYIEHMLAELGVLGKKIDCDFLVVLLEMARQEATDIKNNHPSATRPRTRKKGGGEEITAEELAAIFVRKYSSTH